MKKSKFTESQIAIAIKEAETGTKVEEVCRQIGLSSATFFNWKKKYGGLGVSVRPSTPGLIHFELQKI